MFKKIAVFFFSFVFLFSLSVGIFLYWGIYLAKDKSAEEQVFFVRTGDSLALVAEKLEEEGFIKGAHFFVIYGLISESGKMIKPGSYNLSSSMSVIEIMEKVVLGGEDRLVVVEGWNLRDIGEYLEKNGYGTKEDFFKIVGRPSIYKEGEVFPQVSGSLIYDDLEIFSYIKKDMPLEGFLFPDTYFIVPGTDVEEVVRTMLLNFERRVDGEIREKIEESEFSFYEIITIASLIEKEVIDYEDKRIVSGIIRKRLNNGMRLQLDATITYLTGRRSVNVPITETRIDSPYNTYFYGGLPIGPICSPGIESIRAALDPKETDFLYYLSKPTGETVFSKNFNDHVAAKEKYLR